MIAAAVYALVFAILQWTGVIALNWWWILAAAIVLQIPLAKTILFVVFKLCGLFAMPVSWWWIALAIVWDLITLANSIDIEKAS